MKTKDSFHKLIDQIDDEQLLQSYYELIRRLNLNETGTLWNSLSKEEQDELIIAYEESFNPENLIPHDEVKRQHVRWLEK